MSEPIHHLVENDSGKIISLSPGDLFELSLNGNPTSGYQWEIISYDPVLIKPVEKPSFVWSSPLVRAGGRFQFKFQAVDPGQTILRLVYHRPFEKKVEPLREFILTVIISAGE